MQALRILLKWIILKELLDSLENVGSKLVRSFGGCQGLFELVFFRGSENHGTDIWVFQAPGDCEHGLGDSKVGRDGGEFSLLSRSSRRSGHRLEATRFPRMPAASP